MRLDEPAPGLAIAQPDRGFRYGAEAFWLAGFTLESRAPHEHTVLDIGTGSGVIAALLARQGLSAVGVDVRREWQPLWQQTLAGCGLGERLRLVGQDIRDYGGSTFDIVVSNPPFFPVSAGPVSPDPWKRAARSEVNGSLAELVDAGMGKLAPGGRLCLVVPIERESEVRGMAWSVVRSVAVGRRRWLAEIRHDGVCAETSRVAEDSPRARSWYDLARA